MVWQAAAKIEYRLLKEREASVSSTAATWFLWSCLVAACAQQAAAHTISCTSWCLLASGAACILLAQVCLQHPPHHPSASCLCGSPPPPDRCAAGAGCRAARPPRGQAGDSTAQRSSAYRRAARLIQLQQLRPADPEGAGTCAPEAPDTRDHETQPVLLVLGELWHGGTSIKGGRGKWTAAACALCCGSLLTGYFHHCYSVLVELFMHPRRPRASTALLELQSLGLFRLAVNMCF